LKTVFDIYQARLHVSAKGRASSALSLPDALTHFAAVAKIFQEKAASEFVGPE
jgi:hypothetical protein